MATPPPKRPEDLDRITDLRRFRKEREAAKRRAAPKPKAPSQSVLGSNPRAGLILIVIVLVLAALYLGPRLL